MPGGLRPIRHHRQRAAQAAPLGGRTGASGSAGWPHGAASAGRQLGPTAAAQGRAPAAGLGQATSAGWPRIPAPAGRGTARRPPRRVAPRRRASARQPRRAGRASPRRRVGGRPDGLASPRAGAPIAGKSHHREKNDRKGPFTLLQRIRRWLEAALYACYARGGRAWPRVSDVAQCSGCLGDGLWMSAIGWPRQTRLRRGRHAGDAAEVTVRFRPLVGGKPHRPVSSRPGNPGGVCAVSELPPAGMSRRCLPR
jgi:hypothetical protein